MSAVAGVSDAAIAVRDRLRGKIGLTRVRRYWRGTLPHWASDLNDADDYERIPRAASVLDSVSPRRHRGARDDRHLGEDREELRGDLRLHGEVVPAAEEEEGEPREVEAAAAEDDEAQDERRRRIRERWLLRKRGAEDVLPKKDEELEVESESNSESEHEAGSEEEEACIAVVKPAFVPKPRRDTIMERERIEEERRQLEELVKRRMEERKVETRRIVVEVIIKEQHIDKTQNGEPDADIDTDDEADEANEYEAWKNREIERIKRDRVARLREGEIENVQNMTVEHLERETGNSKPLAKHKKMKFMQRYYHRGAFFQERADDGSPMSGLDDIYERDFSAPTGEDKMDKSILPKVMQVKQFGRRGRVKWTHLVSEDTTDWNSP